MKHLSLIILIFLACCSSINTFNNQADNTTLIKLIKIDNDFNRTDGSLKIDSIVFSKEYRNEMMSDIRVFLAFKASLGQFFHGDTIEIKIDKNTYELKVLEPKTGDYDKNSTVYTRIVAYTYADIAKPKMNVIAMESQLTKEIIDSISKGKLITLSLYTKNTKGVSKNTFEEWDDHVLRDLKKFINYIPKKVKTENDLPAVAQNNSGNPPPSSTSQVRTNSIKAK